MSLISTLSLVVMLCFSFQGCAQNPYEGIPLGQYSVGVKIVEVNQHTERPIQIMVWYPAQSSRTNTSDKITFANYFKASLADRGWDLQLTADSLRNTLSGVVSDTVSHAGDLYDNMLQTTMLAKKDIKPVRKKFPLIIWGARHFTEAGQALLSEMLASHGYIIAFVRKQGKPDPLPYQMREAEQKLSVFNCHMRDLEVAIGHLKLVTHVDFSSLAVFTWSYAYETAIALQLKYSQIKLCLGLSSMLKGRTLYNPLAWSENMDTSRLSAAFVLIEEKVAPNGQENLKPTFFNQIKGPTHYFQFPDMAHGNFNLLEGYLPNLYSVKKVRPYVKASPTQVQDYRQVMNLVLLAVDH